MNHGLQKKSYSEILVGMAIILGIIIQITCYNFYGDHRISINVEYLSGISIDKYKGRLPIGLIEKVVSSPKIHLTYEYMWEGQGEIDSDKYTGSHPEDILWITNEQGGKRFIIFSQKPPDENLFKISKVSYEKATIASK